mmetsp:Transcript_19037/g.59258  ORF Transcript_19037/g.59258 Transcript_19037/m.59258 type:complete len:269 (-) Transcript_19037:543-1349(-)
MGCAARAGGLAARASLCASSVGATLVQHGRAQRVRATRARAARRPGQRSGLGGRLPALRGGLRGVALCGRVGRPGQGYVPAHHHGQVPVGAAPGAAPHTLAAPLHELRARAHLRPRRQGAPHDACAAPRDAGGRARRRRRGRLQATGCDLPGGRGDAPQRRAGPDPAAVRARAGLHDQPRAWRCQRAVAHRRAGEAGGAAAQRHGVAHRALRRRQRDRGAATLLRLPPRPQPHGGSHPRQRHRDGRVAAALGRGVLPPCGYLLLRPLH